MTDITLFLFTNGTQIVGRIIEEHEDVFMVEDPLTLVFTHATNTSTSIYTQRMMPLSSDRIVAMNKSVIMAVGRAAPEVEKYYNDMVQKIDPSKLSITADYKENTPVTEEDVNSILDMVEKSRKTVH